MLVRSPIFWVATVIFLAVLLGAIWLFFPKLLADWQSNRQNLNTINAQISTEREFLTLLEMLSADSTALDQTYEQARSALPVGDEPEVLLLQLNELNRLLGLDATVTVPFTTKAATSATTVAPTDENDIKAGSIGSNQPVVTSNDSTGGKTTFTVSGKFGFDSAKTLLAQLRTMGRWNKINSIDLIRAGETITVSVTSQVFTKAAPEGKYLGSGAQFLTKAQQFFAAFKSYASPPDITKEGRYGRADPFTSP